MLTGALPTPWRRPGFSFQIPTPKSAEEMSVEITDHSGGILTTGVSGKLTQPELAALQSAAGDFELADIARARAWLAEPPPEPPSR
jgi:hypothetical protein